MEESWEVGRRVVELKLLAEGLKECIFCKEPLCLNSCTGEKKYGLASILYVACRECGNTNSVPTGKRHIINGKGPARCFDINTKLAAAMINAGIGEQQVYNILAELNLPTIHHITLKEREREIGYIIEDVAEKSCNSAIQAEILCSESGDAPSSSSVGIDVSSDGRWQKRGTGRSYNSLSAHKLQSSHLKFALQRGGREGLLTILKGKLRSVNSEIDKVISFYKV